MNRRPVVWFGVVCALGVMTAACVGAHADDAHPPHDSAAVKVETDRVSPLPFGLDLRRDMSPWVKMGAIIVGTYFLEDPTTIFTGLMIARGQIDPVLALTAIIIGIFTGDLALYLIGRVVGRRALVWPPLARRLPTRRIEKLGAWFDRHGWGAVLASRFVPGSRFPLYVAAGALGKRPGRFALWTLIAVVIWSTVILMAVVVLGEAAASPLRLIFGDGPLALIAAVILLLLLVRVLLRLTTAVGRARLWVNISTLWRWEFWPLWVFYPPILLYIGLLSLRNGGLRTLTAVNPAMPASGLVDESKSDILAALPQQWVVPWALVDDVESLRQTMSHRGWSYPLILKPDAGQRGYGLRKVSVDRDAAAYFEGGPSRVLAQVYHPGPFEAGVFYVREPGHTVGRIISLTDKAFPVIVGDGKHTIEQLIFRHPRYRMQWKLFLRRHGDQRDVVAVQGQRLTLATSGNHCQGTMFLDGSHLITADLTQQFHRIAMAYPGFHFGRFDVRYADPTAFARGEGFAIVELNGLTSEATHIYDPKLSLWNAYRTLFAQWRIAFAIGAANRAAGAQTTPLREVWRMMRRHYRTRSKGGAIAD